MEKGFGLRAMPTSKGDNVIGEAMLDTPLALSVVLPTYQEAGSIGECIRSVLFELDAFGDQAELIVVDDASPDGTGALVEAAFVLDARVRVLHRKGVRGLASSILDGVRAAGGTRIAVMDADFNHDPADLPRLLAKSDAQTKGPSIVSGSRFIRGGGMYSRARLTGSRVMNRFAAAVLGVPATDFFAGFFVIERAALQTLPLGEIFRGYGDFFPRLLFAASARGWSIIEIPVVYPPRRAGHSKTRFVSTAIRYVIELVRIRRRGI